MQSSIQTKFDMKKNGYVYILTNNSITVLYTGVTSDLTERIQKYKSGFYKDSFTSRYNVTKLVYYELFESIEDAIAREKQIKAVSRKKKIELIEKRNPEWKDLITNTH